MTLTQYQPIAQKIADIIDYVMVNELRITPPEVYILDSAGERVALGAIFNPLTLGRSKAVYESAETTGRISLAIGGLPIVITQRKSHMKYIIPLTGRPHLPRMVELPAESHPDRVHLGMRHNQRAVIKPWDQLGHIMVAGKTRTGKSAFLRLLAFQALRAGRTLAIADNDRSTFPMLKDHPSLFEPIAADPESAAALIERLSDKCDVRARLFEGMTGFPDRLDEYNKLAEQHGVSKLPHILVILDELSNTIIATKSRKGLTEAIGALGMRGLKFGLQIVFAAHEFTKEQIGIVRPQCETVICFRNEAREMSALMGCAGAERIPQDRTGMMVTNKWGKLQAFFLDKSRLGGGSDQTQPLSENESALAWRAIREAGGKMTIELLMVWGLGQQDARRLGDDWELRGWLKRDAAQGNARYVTPKLADLLTNQQSQQTQQTADKPQQTGNKPQQTPDMDGE